MHSHWCRYALPSSLVVFAHRPGPAREASPVFFSEAPFPKDLLRHPWLKLGREPVPYVRAAALVDPRGSLVSVS